MARRVMSRMASVGVFPIHPFRHFAWNHVSVLNTQKYSLMLRPLHWSRKLEEADNQKEPFENKVASEHRPQELQKTPSSHELVESPKKLYDNYPRSLRELALKARGFARARTEDAAGPAQGTTGPPKSSATRNTPTQEDLLRYARGFWTRMRIRFKWFTIRGFRRFNVDELSAFFTLGGLGTAIWVIVGT